jgi:hypothetical protein
VSHDIQVAEGAVVAQAVFEVASVAPLRLRELAEPRLVICDDRVDRPYGDGPGTWPELSVQDLEAPPALVGDREPLLLLGRLGETGRDLEAELEQGVELERRGVAVARHGREVRRDVEWRVGSDPIGSLRDGAQQPQVGLPRDEPVAGGEGPSRPGTANEPSTAESRLKA